MTDPELLLLDEPGAGMDISGREDLVERLTALAADPYAPATVLITHHLEEIPAGFTLSLIHIFVRSAAHSKINRVNVRKVVV